VEVDEGQRKALVSLMFHKPIAKKTYQWPVIIPIRKQCTTDKQVDTRIGRGLKSSAKNHFTKNQIRGSLATVTKMALPPPPTSSRI